MENLIARLRHMGVLLVIGLLLIIYIAFGFLYWQQGSQQRELDEQITKLSLVVSRQLPSGKELQAEYDNVTELLAPMTDQDAIEELVGIAEENGIDVDPASGKFRVSSAAFSQAKVGGGNYQLLSFRNIHVQGDYGNVMAFISDLDSGKTENMTMVLNKVVTSQVEIKYIGEEGARRAEFRNVASAVTAMMVDNALSEIPEPMSFAGGIATNLMGDDPDTEGTVEGFPDITTTVVYKGYTGTGLPRGGYVLYEHDIIPTDNTTQFETVSYITTLTTKYYYTCETDGTVRQFDGANIITAMEYLGSEESKIETVTAVNVDIYTKPEA